MSKLQTEKVSMELLRKLVREEMVALNEEADVKKKVTKKDSEIAVKAVTNVLFNALKGGKHAGLSGLGTLELRERGSRKGRNPQTGDELVIEARTAVAFVPSGSLRKAVK